eukprot:3428076-Pleurochrysis_carterae.AAC.1
MAEDLAAVRRYTRERGLSLVYTSIFRHGVQSALFRAVRPPSKKHLGSKLRKLPSLPCLLAVFEEMTSVSRGLPTTSVLE